MTVISKRAYKKILHFFVSVTFVLTVMLVGLKSAIAIEVLVHSSVEIEKVSVRELRAIFAIKRQRWPDSSPVTVVVLSGSSALHRQFCKEVLQLFPHQLQTGWDRMVYSGRGAGPVVVANEKEMMEVLEKTPGSVGYVSGAIQFEALKVLEIKSQ